MIVSERSKALAISLGGISERADRFFNLGPQRRPMHRDLFEFIDRVALIPGYPILGVQETSLDNMPARFKKIAGTPRIAEKARLWIVRGGRIEIWGHGVRGKRGERKRVVSRRWWMTYTHAEHGLVWAWAPVEGSPVV
jgi:hypothetical protein